MKTNNEKNGWVNSEKGNLISQKIKNVVDFINEHYSEDLKLALVGLHFGYHPDYLCRKFTKEMGVTFHEYILNVRFKKAIDLLVDSEMGIKEISFKVGFSRPEVFSRAFRRLAGCSPREFRNHYPVLGKVSLEKKPLPNRVTLFPSIPQSPLRWDLFLGSNVKK